MSEDGWPLVSVVVVTYRRPDLLERTLATFRANTDYPRVEVIVTDDGSPRWQQERVARVPADKHLLNPRHRGMGANANAGLRASTGDYILLLQDDWECQGPPEYLREAVHLLERDPSLGFVKFYHHRERYAEERVGTLTDGYVRIEPPHLVTPLTRNVYSDTPHVRSRRSLEVLGFYSEVADMEAVEREYCLRFLAQSQLRAAHIPRFTNRVFEHIGSDRSLRTRRWRHRLGAAAKALGTDELKRVAPRVYRPLKSLYCRLIGIEETR